MLGGQINGAKIASAVLYSILVGGIKQSITYKKSSDFGCPELQSNVWDSLIGDFFSDSITIQIVTAEFPWKLQFHFFVTLKTKLRLILSMQAR